ncbi:hypothetical protein C8J56DRAFT_925321 [Mycena floridula]|nr:hypothetical protein C8J56DRAFT_925321 [Mycena floridula]
MLYSGEMSNGQADQPSAVQTMRLRDDPPAITPANRTSRKRKSPPSNTSDLQQSPQSLQQLVPPGHPMMHPLPPAGFQYNPADFSSDGMPLQPPPQQSQSPPAEQGTPQGRALSQSKRAEQNRKAQRAFRERRDQHVKALESRSQLLDAALASADEANRRWEECRALVDQLRVENSALRAALSQQHGAQMMPPGPQQSLGHSGLSEEVKKSGGGDDESGAPNE